MIKQRGLFVILLGISLLASCVSSKEVVYLQNVDSKIEAECEYKTVINNDDLLSIIVSCDDLEAATPFNTPMIGLGNIVNSSNNRTPLGYLVDKKGNIDFPVLGKMKVAGITRSELADTLKTHLSKYLNNPIVTIQYLNFRVTVLGEVKNAGSYPVNSERISILDAIGLAGDLQINAKRKNVLVIREKEGQKTTTRLDLTSPAILNSDFFYLQQNDVVYVEPNRGRVVGGNASAFLPYILSSVSTLVAVVALIMR